MNASSGIGTYMCQVLGHIRGLGNCSFTAFCGDPASVPSGMDHVPWASRPYDLKEQWPGMRARFRTFDAVWCPHYVHPLRYGGRLVVTVHDLMHLTEPEYGSPWKRAFAWTLFRDIRKRADVVLFNSRSACDLFSEMVGPPQGAWAVTPLGVNQDWFSVEPAARLHDRPYVVFVGNVKPHKNLVRLMRAMKALPDLDLVIVGRRDGFITKDKRVVEVAGSLGERVCFTDWLEIDRLRQWVAQARLLAFPSLVEGFGLPPLEAMAAGTPVVAGNIRALRETCGDAACFVDPLNVDGIAEGLRRLHLDEGLRQDLIVKGKQRAASFSWRRCAEQTVSTIEATLG